MSESEQGASALTNTAADSVAAVSSSSPSLAQRCDQDGLSVVFSFCQGLHGVVAAAQTCHSWRAAALLRQSSCRASLELSRSAFLQLLQSPLRFHVAGLTLRDAMGEDVLQLHSRCPQLGSVVLSVDGHSVAALSNSAEGAAAFHAHTWPSSLRALSFRETGSFMGVQLFVNALPFSASQLQSLSVPVTDGGAMVDLAPLLQLPHLTRLLLLPRHWPSNLQLSIVKQLRTLTELDVGGGHWRAETLDALAFLDAPGVGPFVSDQPHQLHHLQRLGLYQTNLEAKYVPSLLTLPSLTELCPRTILPNCFPLLRFFPHLRSLRIAPPLGSCDEAAVVELLSSLRALPSLTSFELSGKGVRTHVLQSLLDGLGTAVLQLHELRIEHAYLPPVNGLSTCTQLRSLILHDCTRESSAAGDNVLALLQSLSFLERLELRACRLSLTELHRAQLTPPSSLVPSLKQLIWVM